MVIDSLNPRLVEMPDIFTSAERKKRPATVTILKPLPEVYAFFRDFSYFSRGMDELDRVEAVSKDVHRWFARGSDASWDTKVLVDEAPHRFAWKSEEGNALNMVGGMTFEPALEGRATVVSMKVIFPSPAGRLAALLKKVQGEDPDTQAIKCLRALKSLLETGEVPTTQGQPSGREESAAA